MEGTRFQDGVLVDSNQLNNAETSLAINVLRNRTHNWETGIRQGAVLTVNTANQNRVDLSSGDGYDVSGNYINFPPLGAPGNPAAQNVSLADPSLGAINYVYAFYTEVGTVPMPHETNGTAPFTIAVASFLLQVLTAAQYAALPFTDLTFSGPSQDRSLLLGIVTGTGGNLTAGSIQQPAPWRNLNYATVGAPPILGVEIIAVGDSTPTGSTGQLQFTVSPNTIAWQAPGESGPGPGVAIPADGTYTLTALGGSTIQIEVTETALPLVGQNVSVTITGLYLQTVPRESNTDRHHRSLIGTGTPTPQNPHGLSLADIDPGGADELATHQRLEHANGIWRGSSAPVLQVAINEAAAPDSLTLVAPVGSDTFYINGLRLSAITSTSLTFTDAVPGPAKELYEIYLDESGNPLKSKRAAFQNQIANITGIENNLVYMSPSVAAGTHTLTYVSAGVNAGGTLQWDDGPLTTVPAGIVAATGALFLLSSGVDQVQVFFGQAALVLGLMAGTYTDNIIVNAAVDETQHLILAQVSYAGVNTGALGYTPNRGTVAAKLFDLRLFGTLTEFDIRDDTLHDKIEIPLAEHSPDGVVLGALDPTNATGSLAPTAGTGLALALNGTGVVYVRGKRYEVLGTTLDVPDNASTLVFVDVTGTVVQLPFSAAIGFLAVGKAVWNIDQQDEPFGAALALVTSAGGQITSVIDMRRNLSGGNVTVEPWSVGQIHDGAIGLFGEFLSIAGALTYALAASQPALHVLDVYVDAPVAVPHTVASLTLWGGTLRLASNLLSASPNGVIELAESVDLSLRDVQIFNEASYTGNAASSLVYGAGNNNVSLANLRINVTGVFQGIVRLTDSFGSLHASGVTWTSGVTGQGSFAVLDAAPAVQLSDVNILDSAFPVAGLIEANGSAGNVRVFGASSAGGAPLVSGSGSLASSVFAGCTGFAPPSLAGGCSEVTFRDGSFEGNWPGPLANCTLEALSFAGASTSLTGVSASGLIECSGGTLILSGMTNSTLSGCTSSNEVQMGGCSDLVIEACTAVQFFFSGGTQSHIRLVDCVATATGALAGVHCAPGTNLADIRLRGCTAGTINFTWIGTDTRKNIEITGCTLASVICAQSDPTIYLPNLGIEVHHNTFTGGFAGGYVTFANFSGGSVTDNDFQNVWLNDAYGVVQIGSAPTNIGVGGEAFTATNNIRVDRNRFSVTQAAPLSGISGWFPAVVEAAAHFGVNNQKLGLSVSDNRVTHATGDNSAFLFLLLLNPDRMEVVRVHNNQLRYDNPSLVSGVTWITSGNIYSASSTLSGSNNLGLVASVATPPTSGFWSGGSASGNGGEEAFNLSIQGNQVEWFGTAAPGGGGVIGGPPSATGQTLIAMMGTMLQTAASASQSGSIIAYNLGTPSWIEPPYNGTGSDLWVGNGTNT